MNSIYCLFVEIIFGFDEDSFTLDSLFMVGELPDDKQNQFKVSCLIRPDIKHWIYQEFKSSAPGGGYRFSCFDVVRFDDLPALSQLNICPYHNPELKQAIEEMRLRCFNSDNKNPAPVAVAPAAAPAVSDSPAVLFVPEFDGSDDWIKTSDMAQEMVNNEISIDIEAAKKHLRNMKSNGRKSAEKYDGKNSSYGEIDFSSFQVKWRMVKNGGKWSVYFYCPSLKWKQK